MDIHDADLRPDDMRKGLDARPRPNDAVLQHRVRADHHVVDGRRRGLGGPRRVDRGRDGRGRSRPQACRRCAGRRKRAGQAGGPGPAQGRHGLAGPGGGQGRAAFRRGVGGGRGRPGGGARTRGPGRRRRRRRRPHRPPGRERPARPVRPLADRPAEIRQPAAAVRHRPGRGAPEAPPRPRCPARLGDPQAAPAGQAGRLFGPGHRRHRDLPGRRRLRRRLGQAGPQPQDPGDPAAARQDPERRVGLGRQAGRQQGTVRPAARPRRPAGKEVQGRGPALRARRDRHAPK